MNRKILIAGAACIALLAGCGTNGGSAREDFGFSSTAEDGTPFDLTVKTGPLDPAKDGRRLSDAHDNQSMKLGESETSGGVKCANPGNHDEMYELTFQMEVSDPSANPDVSVLLQIADKQDKPLTTEGGPSIAIAWLTEDRATCQSTAEGTFGEMSLDKDEEFQVKGLLVLPGGADKYKGYTLTVGTTGGKVTNLKGGAVPYATVGVTVPLVP